MPQKSERRTRAYKEHHQTKQSREISVIAAEIGPLPEVVDPDRKEACRNDLLLFLTGRSGDKTVKPYFPHSTGRHPVSADHEKFIRRLQSSILEGGRQVEAVYRYFGKTSIGEGTTIWATYYGHQKFVLIASADNPAAESILQNIRLETETNQDLYDDFPEVCFPFRELDGKIQRAPSQTVDGVLTRISYRHDDLRLPMITGAPSSGAVIKSRSLLTVNRGMKVGTSRVGWVFVDDPQTDESALSTLQTQKRIDKLYKTILKLGSHDTALACFIAGTVIRPFDLMAQLLDPELHPSWRGIRVPMIRHWASKEAHERLWLTEYAKLRNSFDREDPDSQRRAHKKATAYYKKNREQMDAGVKVSWEHCFSPDKQEISAVQHAYNLLIDDGEDVFAAECQNEPGYAASAIPRADPRALARKQHYASRSIVPMECNRLTAFVDIQQKLLYYLVCGWDTEFSGYVVEYGTFPEQKSKYFTLAQARISLRRVFRNADLEGCITAGLDKLVGGLMKREFTRSDGKPQTIDKILIDSAWQTAAVKSYVRSTRSRLVEAARGVGIGPTKMPISEYKLHPGNRRGRDWIEKRPRGDPTKVCEYDSNSWKTHAAEGLNLEYGSRGSISLYRAEPNEHRMLIDHLMAETSERLSTDSRSCIVWSLPRVNQDNHLWDCLVGSQVAASMCGIQRPTDKKPRARPVSPKPRKREAVYL